MGQTAQASLAQISHAVPNRSLSSAQSYYGLIRSTAQQIQLAKDMRDFGNQPAGNGMTMRQAIQAQNPNNPYAWQDAFVQNHPPEMYTSRVQPLSAPVDAKGNVDATKLQNGFDYQINGNVFQATPNGPAAVDELGNAAQ
jgi:hypothetical protein